MFVAAETTALVAKMKISALEYWVILEHLHPALKTFFKFRRKNVFFFFSFNYSLFKYILPSTLYFVNYLVKIF